MPGNDSSWCEISSRSLPASITMSPLASRAQALIKARPRAAGMAKSAGDAPAIVAAAGNTWVMPATGVVSGSPLDATSRAASVRAPLTGTPWARTPPGSARRARPLGGDRRAEHRPREQPDPVGVPGGGEPRPLANQWRQDRIVAEV